ncbi:hypothetical protein O0I10_001556 [Lichtheimia ornata]|uniref:Uncharacterized protein n=1 Tax=Lichtheimia ornata TaxID=688661 RepID=A0AAD7VBH3_9FUNG|nr:uncharacterized protein O0I10_001556 [Lichtheimia ornata]KAJ8662594.1 hypothetical protein O0I10_001556 [Lichtheimia ornata]
MGSFENPPERVLSNIVTQGFFTSPSTLWLRYLHRQYRSLIRLNRHHHNDESYQARLQQLRHDIDNSSKMRKLIILHYVLVSKWREYGERSNKYFYECLKDRQVAKYIPAIANEDGTLATTPDDMVSRAHDFLTASCINAEAIDTSALSNILQAIPEDLSIAEDDQELLAMPWSDDEILNGISRSPYRSSPGVDGFPYELLRFLYGHPRVKPLCSRFSMKLSLWRVHTSFLAYFGGDSFTETR